MGETPKRKPRIAILTGGGDVPDILGFSKGIWRKAKGVCTKHEEKVYSKTGVPL